MTLLKENTDRNTLKDKEHLKAALHLLQDNLRSYFNKADLSMEMLVKLGEKTDLAIEIEEMMTSPLDSINKLMDRIDAEAVVFMDLVIKSFLKNNKNIVAGAVRTDTGRNDLHYYIALKKDTSGNRKRLFRLVDSYDAMEMSKKQPLYFQFVPKELIGDIRAREIIQI